MQLFSEIGNAMPLYTKAATILLPESVLVELQQVAQRIRQARGASKLSREQVAFRAGFSVRTIAHLEDGKHIPLLHTVARVAEVLEISLDWVVWGDGEMARRRQHT
jgi:ribosome-binding protein aMBF1 (putative translation factor)